MFYKCQATMIQYETMIDVRNLRFRPTAESYSCSNINQLHEIVKIIFMAIYCNSTAIASQRNTHIYTRAHAIYMYTERERDEYLCVALQLELQRAERNDICVFLLLF